MDDENEDSVSFVDGSESRGMGEEWISWRVDDPQLESDEAAEEEEEELEKGGGRE